MKKILWINPSFLDYRVPVYQNIFRIANGEFTLVFSKVRVNDRVKNKIFTAISDNAIAIDERRVAVGEGNFSNSYIEVSFPKRIYSKIKNKKPDVIISEGFFQWTPFAILYKFFNKTKVFISYERTLHTERNCPKWREFYRKIINYFVDGYLINGYETRKYLESKFNVKNKIVIEGCMSADGESITAKINLLEPLKIKELRRRITNSNGVLFIFVGQLIDRKGIKQLIINWKNHSDKYPNDTLLIIGDGDMKEEIIELEKKNSSVRYLGSINYDEIYKYYSISDVFLLPTLEDNWSLVVPEAMAASLPIGTSIYNGCYPELVKEGINGFVFDPMNESSFQEALLYFQDKDLNQMGKGSFLIQKSYTAQKVAERIYNGVIR